MEDLEIDDSLMQLFVAMLACLSLSLFVGACPLEQSNSLHGRSLNPSGSLSFHGKCGLGVFATRSYPSSPRSVQTHDAGDVVRQRKDTCQAGHKAICSVQYSHKHLQSKYTTFMLSPHGRA